MDDVSDDALPHQVSTKKLNFNFAATATATAESVEGQLDFEPNDLVVESDIPLSMAETYGVKADSMDYAEGAKSLSSTDSKEGSRKQRSIGVMSNPVSDWLWQQVASMWK